jgi:hypothetical protein
MVCLSFAFDRSSTGGMDYCGSLSLLDSHDPKQTDYRGGEMEAASPGPIWFTTTVRSGINTVQDDSPSVEPKLH